MEGSPDCPSPLSCNRAFYVMRALPRHDTCCGPADIAGLSPFAFSVIAGIVATFPLMFIPSFKKLSWLSLLGCISTVVVTVTVIAAVAMDPMREKMPQQVHTSPKAPVHCRVLHHAAASIGVFCSLLQQSCSILQASNARECGAPLSERQSVSGHFCNASDLRLRLCSQRQGMES